MMKAKYLNIVYVLVFLFIGFNYASGSNKHFYNPINGDGGSDITIGSANDYKLFQNYPNPFNPTTKISYKINVEGMVVLQVYNLVGQVIKVLVSETQSPGRYEVEFDGSELTSGVYLYKLQINGFTSVKRMTLLK
jgi:hypothetical protein